ncbi:MAG TPA: hydrogenase nickel incorporation protein HypB [Thermoanaerobaculia bacterium]
MCRDCGCGDPEIVPVEVQAKILEGNDRVAAHNREHLFGGGILAVNLMGSPGSGKTAVLERTAGAFARRFRLAAITADLATDNDASRLIRAGIPSRSITTGTACHLDARLVHDALHDFDLAGVGILFIENVGNLVCPAVYDLGEAANVVALSVTEGEDKPLKYPTMFMKADLVLITKTDLVPHLDIDVARIRENLARVMPEPRALEISARTGEGVPLWIEWLEARRAAIGPATEHVHAHGGE